MRNETLHERTVRLLTEFYAVMGNPPETVGALNAMAGALLEEASIEEIAVALRECRRVEYPVRLPHILNCLPQRRLNTEQKQQSDAIMAWGRVLEFTDKYVGNNEQGHYSPNFGAFGPRGPQNERGEYKYPATYPALPERDLDAVRRTGGWEAYKCADRVKDIPHLQRRFIEAWSLWQPETAGSALPPREVRQLAAKSESMPSADERAENIEALRKGLAEIAERFSISKPNVKQSMTREQVRERKEFLNQQAADITRLRQQNKQPL